MKGMEELVYQSEAHVANAVSTYGGMYPNTIQPLIGPAFYPSQGIDTSGWDFYTNERTVEGVSVRDGEIVLELDDGSTVVVDGFFDNALGIKIRVLLQTIMTDETLTEEMAEKFVVFKELLALQKEEMVMAEKRLRIAEKLLSERLEH